MNTTDIPPSQQGTDLRKLVGNQTAGWLRHRWLWPGRFW